MTGGSAPERSDACDRDDPSRAWSVEAAYSPPCRHRRERRTPGGPDRRARRARDEPQDLQAHPVARRAASCARPRSAAPAAPSCDTSGSAGSPATRRSARTASGSSAGAASAGAEIPVTLLFADIRGSTAHRRAAQRRREFHDFLVALLRIGVGSDPRPRRARRQARRRRGHRAVLRRRDGPAPRRGGDRRRRRPRGARRAVRTRRPIGPIPIGAAVHTGIAYVGPTGPEGAVDDFTALGDAVNTTARLASAAAAGELFVSVAAAKAAATCRSSAERRTLEVRGREATIDVMVLRPTG